MSTEIATILSNAAALVQTGLDEDTAAIAGSVGSKRISIAGGTFRMMVNGKEQAAIEDRHMNVVFVKMAHDPSRTWYAQAYKEGEKASPSCWSQDSKTPHPEVKEPPAPTCAACPNAIKGSGQGGMGTACRLSWRTAVVLPQQLDGPVYQLVLPATSSFGSEDNGRWPFRPYVQMLASHNVSAGAVITKMQFDTKAKVPRVLFSPAGAVDQNDMETIRNQGKTPAAENAIRLTVYQSDESEGSEPVKRAGVKRDVVVEEPATDGTPQDLVKKWAKKSA
jgi:hypothetical protein